ncbi:hypothetical protein A4X06_0g6164 [Tilletia controversa]|uniref:Uncharacterized protein n=2 Tax=Tilletia TaxID=13289 RepID=A0A8X7MPT2_9BASI|nr:hypothetical protein CF336_g8515 [Tilletia laevis]KAE8183306.1 hypothetical protein CF328_g8224 [Tilletia controversa]KAE8183956.1 hypothetical protein CF335_g8165 [Tilletia laevis]KAE8241174.1 hypothetical protein A4X03_0g8200 [Tilletia caries]KAE8243666.1 hypothetical protein A4X06_0g6164 [Tilletia controversa]
MLVGLAGLVSSYDANHELDSGATYPADVNHVTIRIIMALYGVTMVPVAYSTSGNWRAPFDRHHGPMRQRMARHLSLHSPRLVLLYFTFHGMVKFHSYQNQTFSVMWWFWIIFTRASNGAVTSTSPTSKGRCSQVPTRCSSGIAFGIFMAAFGSLPYPDDIFTGACFMPLVFTSSTTVWNVFAPTIGIWLSFAGGVGVWLGTAWCRFPEWMGS